MVTRKLGIQICKECEEHVRWAKTVNGKPIMLNFSPDDDGNQVFVGRGEVMQLAGAELDRERDTGGILFKVHRTDCAAEKALGSGRMPQHVRDQLQRSHGAPARRARG